MRTGKKNNEQTEKKIEAALAYAALGYKVLPICVNSKIPATKHGVKDATFDLEQIKKWWAKELDYNIAITADGILVIDIDSKTSEWFSEENIHNLKPWGAVTSTPNGFHLIYNLPKNTAWRNSVKVIASDVDIKTTGGYILMPPSTIDHWDYCVGQDDNIPYPLNRPLAELPLPTQWIVDQINKTTKTKTKILDLPQELMGAIPLATPPKNSTKNNGKKSKKITPPHDTPDQNQESWQLGKIKTGERNNTLASIAGKMRHDAHDYPSIAAALQSTNRTRCYPPLPAGEVDRIARSISGYDPEQANQAIMEGWDKDFLKTDDAKDEYLASAEAKYLMAPQSPLPSDYYRVPGFISTYIDHCLATAPYPNEVLAFTGAITMIAHLTGRKIRDKGDNRTNIWALGLANSAAGKDRPRKLNIEILDAIETVKDDIDSRGEVAGNFVSGEGVQDALKENPNIFFMTDEIDNILTAIKNSRETRYEGIMATLMTVYSSANGKINMRKRANAATCAKAINQPCLVLFGTAIPCHYYEALSEKMLTNGFFGRMLILECGTRMAGQEPMIKPLPKDLIDFAQGWHDFQTPSDKILAQATASDSEKKPKNDLSFRSLTVYTVPHTKEADEMLRSMRIETEYEYAKAERHNDPVGMTVWGRASENVRKLSLLYAASQSFKNPIITPNAVAWAQKFVFHQIRRMLFMAQGHVSDSLFDADCLKAVKHLTAATHGRLKHSALLRKMRMDAFSFTSLIETLTQRGQITVEDNTTKGRTGKIYLLSTSQ